jgi:rSAM/selenodomain-associated transferase 1
VTRPVVIVMVKAPMPGTVKTRLVPPLTAESAAGLAAALVQDAVRNNRQIADVLIAYAPADGNLLLETLLPNGLHWTAQRGSDLGERMGAAMADAVALGFSPLVVVGTDSPTLPPEHIAEAIQTLQSNAADVVFGPAEDGGYYLVGAQQPQPGLFDGVAWSTEAVLTQTAANAARLHLRCHLLPAWYDIDTGEDLARLQRELEEDPTVRERIPATAQWAQG